MDLPVVRSLLRRLPSGPVVSVTVTAVTLAALIAMAEIDRLIAAAVDGEGRFRSLTGLIGPSATGGQQRSSWDVWYHVPKLREALAGWIAVHTLIDVLFIVGYAVLGFRLLRVGLASAARRILGVLVVVDVVEDVLLLCGAGKLAAGPVPEWFAWTVAVAATIKWVTVAVLLVAVLRTPQLLGSIRDGLHRTGRAVWVQRLSFVVVVVIGALTLVPGPDVSDQLPDVQRAWVGQDGTLTWSAAWGVVVTVAVAAALFVLGRARAVRSWSTRVELDVPTQPAVLTWWLLGPAVAAVVWLGFVLGGGAWMVVDGRSLAIFISVPVGLVTWSWALGRSERAAGTTRRRAAVDGALGVLTFAVAVIASVQLADWWLLGWIVVLVVVVPAVLAALWWLLPARVWSQKKPDEPDRGRAEDVATAGDVLAIAVLLVGGLGLIRSFTAPVLLHVSDLARAGGRLPWEAVMLAFGYMVVLAGPVLAARARRAVSAGSPRDVPWFSAWIVAGTASVLLGWFTLHPTGLSTTLGVAATTGVAIGGWAVIIGLLIVNLQSRKPLEIFRVVHVEANPVITLLAAALLLVSLAGGDPDLHALRTDGGPASVRRDSLDTVFENWVTRSGACDRPVPVDGRVVQVRPMLLVAASGGGIRSAVWTAHVLDQLATNDCGRTATVLSSGVSGGSVGLVLSRTAGAGGTVPAATALAEPRALGAAAAGLLVRDLLGGLTGLRGPAYGDGQNTWEDRAGLMESVWEGSVPALAAPFGPEVVGPAGALILNSTDADSHCRVLVSQIELGGKPTPSGPPMPSGTVQCRAGTGLPASSLDLLDTYGGCTPRISWATAAMLSARFPIVTPAGRVPRPGSCAAAADLRLVDGGYAEGSGIGTLADLSPRLAEVVRDHNAQPGVPIVVPIVVYLEDETRAELESPPPALAPELFVPLVGAAAAGQMTASGTWMQRATDGLADPCPREDPAGDCAAAVAQIRAQLPQGGVVVAPVTQPSVDAPLGWMLSPDSQERLSTAFTDQVTTCRGVAGYGCFQELLTVLGRAPR